MLGIVDWLNSYRMCSVAYSYSKCSGRVSEGRLRTSATWKTDRRIMLAPHLCSSQLCWTPPTVTFPCLGISFSLSSNKAVLLSFSSVLTLISYALKFVYMMQHPYFLGSQKCVQPLFHSLWFLLHPPYHFSMPISCAVFKLPWCWLYMHGCRRIYWKVGSFSGPHLRGKLSPP